MSADKPDTSEVRSVGCGDRRRECVRGALERFGWLVIALTVLIAILLGWLIEPRVPVSGTDADVKDFFSNIVGLCIVVLFAKFVSHNSRVGRNEHYVWTGLHGLCSFFAGLGVFAALRGAEGGRPGVLYELAWVGAGISTVILAADIALVSYLRR